MGEFFVKKTIRYLKQSGEALRCESALTLAASAALECDHLWENVATHIAT
jgi:hypothetical protein